MENQFYMLLDENGAILDDVNLTISFSTNSIDIEIHGEMGKKFYSVYECYDFLKAENYIKDNENIVELNWNDVKNYVTNQLKDNENWELAVKIIDSDWKPTVIERMTDLYLDGLKQLDNVQENDKINIDKEYIQLREFMIEWLEQ